MDDRQPRYALHPDTGAFVVHDYNRAKPFSNFLPGIAGPWGIPLWVYWVNRGQAIASFGVRDKNGQIMEFQSFNHACARVPTEGFRTFLRLDGGAVHEPFQRTRDPEVEQVLRMLPHEIAIRETNRRLGVEVEVAWVPLPNLPYAALARHTTVRDLTGRARRLEWVDGAARLLPYGLDQERIKFIARHVEAMMGVVDVAGVPLFRLKQTAADSEQVGAVRGGHFYLVRGGALGRDVVVDPEAVFGEMGHYATPWIFEDGGARGVLAEPQLLANKTPCAFAVRDEELPAGGQVEVVALAGYVPDDAAVGDLAGRLANDGFLAAKRAENGRVVAEIGQRAFCISAEPAFDAYARQDFVDNVMRGGMPFVFDTKGGKSAFYAYSRQNGDLERDYHFFVLEPTYLSQGTGHYRSILQNRRTDGWFFPEVEDANLKLFLDLVQLDGYNPLEVTGVTYRVADPEGLDRWLAANVADPALRVDLAAWMARSFTPGELVMRMETDRAIGERPREEVLAEVLAFCVENENGALHEGFWVDHWHYNFDTLDVVRMVWPDRLRAMLVDRRDYTWFDDPDVILPRAETMVDADGRVRHYGAVVRDPEKLARVAARRAAGPDPYRVRTRHGDGEVYRSSLLVKLLTIVTNRLATLDPAGTGVQMEAGKPGWNDSMNGLPGLFGSGLSETVELRRAVRTLREALDGLDLPDDHPVPVHAELATFLRGLGPLMDERLADRSEAGAFRYWDRSNGLKEAYRAATRHGVDGAEEALPLAELAAFLDRGRALLDRIFAPDERDRVLSPEGVPYTYFVNEAVEWEPTGETGHLGLPLVRVTRFRQRPVRLFLEGAVHWLKERPLGDGAGDDAAEAPVGTAKQVYESVRRSALFDRKLSMYKACVNMEGEDPELGRAVGAYPRGWIENESIYLHMEFKWLLEILRSGLAAEFWGNDARNTLMPFLDPATYGRSTLEGASFVVSSAYADERLHGQAFQPRLSGITVEFLHLWLLAVAGERPFRLADDGTIALGLAPRLPGWLFTKTAGDHDYHDPVDGWTRVPVPADAFAFKLVGRTLVVYENPSRADTFGPDGVRPVRHTLHYRDGRTETVEGPELPAGPAAAVRDGAVRRIDCRLG